MLREAELEQICGWEDWTSQLTCGLSLQDNTANTLNRLRHHNQQARRNWSGLSESLTLYFDCQVRSWVLQTILASKTQLERNRQFRTFISLAKSCLDINNFNASYQILTGLR